VDLPEGDRCLGFDGVVHVDADGDEAQVLCLASRPGVQGAAANEMCSGNRYARQAATRSTHPLNPLTKRRTLRAYPFESVNKMKRIA
jgi:hypothetical protein